MMADNVVVAAGSVKTFGDTHMVMMGRVVEQHIEYGSLAPDSGVPMIEIGTMAIDKAVSQVGRDNNNTALISMDGIFCPYVINVSGSGHPSLSSWAIPSSSGGGDILSTDLNPFNPSNMFSTGVNHFRTQAFFDSGHNIAYQNRFERVGEGTTGDLSVYKEIFNNHTANFNTIKAVGLKAPVIITGWGYDTDGRPVPATTGNPDVFQSGAFRDPTLWKSGPLDVRWDSSREVWSAHSDGTKIISFQISSTTTDPSIDRNVYGTVIQTTFQGSIPGALLEGNNPPVQIWDFDGCYLSEPSADLFARRGKAVRMYVNADTLTELPQMSGSYSYAVGDMYWNMLSLCCPALSCEGVI